MAIATPVDLGNTNSTTGLTKQITLSQVVPVGACVVAVGRRAGFGDWMTGVADSAGNTWQSPGDGIIWYSLIATQIPIGGTITGTWATNANIKLFTVLMIPSGIVGYDSNAGFASGTSTAPGLATGALAQAEEIAIAYVTMAATAEADTFTHDATWTGIGSSSQTNGGFIKTAYYINSVGTSSISYTGSNSVSRAWFANDITLKGNAIAPPVRHSNSALMLLGVGS
jgi:hypothetical protein